MKLFTSSAAITELRPNAKPTLTSVTLDVGGTPETLTENNDYVIVEDSTSHSGYSIVFMSAGMTTLTPKTKAITIDYGTNTPIAAKVMTAGSSQRTATPLGTIQGGGNGLTVRFDCTIGAGAGPLDGGAGYLFCSAVDSFFALIAEL